MTAAGLGLSDPDGTDGDAGPAVEVVGVTRRFGATLAVDHVDLCLPAGRVHALVGENGAGKSTLLGVLSGRLAPSSGAVRVHGARLPAADPRAARRAGVAAIYQELTVLPALSAEENVVVGAIPSRWGAVDRAAVRSTYRALASRLEVTTAPGVRAGALSVAQQQQLEIMRALHARARVLLLDEPTAALGAVERDALLGLMRRLRAEGTTMIFVSHHLEEVLEVADTVTVFRDGRLVESAPTTRWDKRSLVAAMLGQPVSTGPTTPAPGPGETGARVATGPAGCGDAVLSLRGVGVPGRLGPVDLDLPTGQILGVAGLVGSGRTTLLRTLAGLEPRATGSIAVADEPAGPPPRSPRASWRRGVAFIPEDRKTQGLVLGQPAMVNAVLARLGRTGRCGLWSQRRLHRQALDVAAPVGVAPAVLLQPAAALSGGNQQKLLLARCLHSRPRLLLADEPTRGIDVGAKAEILASLRRLAAGGVAVLVVSSEIDEVLDLADRVLVLAGGRAVATVDRGDGFDRAAILHAAFDREDSHE